MRMTKLLFIGFLFVIPDLCKAQNGDYPMIIDGRLYEILGDYKMEIKSCEQFRQFKYKFPLFQIDKSILSRFSKCKERDYRIIENTTIPPTFDTVYLKEEALIFDTIPYKRKPIKRKS